MGRDKALSYASNPELWLTSVSITLACIGLIIFIGYILCEKINLYLQSFLGFYFLQDLYFSWLHDWNRSLGYNK